MEARLLPPTAKEVTFTASAIEVERAQHWAKNHYSEAKHGERRDIEWRFIGTGIGTVVQVSCLGCKQALNVTDYDCW